MDLLTRIQAECFADPVDMSLDMQGWMADQFVTYFKVAVEKYTQPLIIEVGTWKGKSCITMAQHLKDNNINGKIIAIDTFLGSPEHMEVHAKELGLRDHGIPPIYKQFLANVQHNDVVKYIYPFPISSIQGGHYLEMKNVMADIIYIDAGHEYESVKLDIEVFWRRLKYGGTMIFDDWSWPGVRKAISEFASQRKSEIQYFDNNGNNAVIIKNQTEQRTPLPL